MGSPRSGLRICNGSIWGVVSWEKTPGGRDEHNPDVSKQSRPSLGMAILIDMKKTPGLDQWEGQSLQRQGRQAVRLDHQAGRSRSYEDSGCVLGFLCGGETWTRVAAPIPSSPASSMARGAGEDAQDRRGKDRRAEDHRLRQSGRRVSSQKQADRRSDRRYLPTPRHRGVYPLAPAETATAAQASSAATAPAACPCSTCRDGSTATGCRTPSPWSSR